MRILGIYDVLPVFDKEIGIYKKSGGVLEMSENNVPERILEERG